MSTFDRTDADVRRDALAFAVDCFTSAKFTYVDAPLVVTTAESFYQFLTKSK